MTKAANKPAAEFSLNELTTEVTAFGSFFEFSEAMTKNGYVPTLTPKVGKAKYIQRQNELRAELAKRLEAQGYKVWLGLN